MQTYLINSTLLIAALTASTACMAVAILGRLRYRHILVQWPAHWFSSTYFVSFGFAGLLARYTAELYYLQQLEQNLPLVIGYGFVCLASIICLHLMRRTFVSEHVIVVRTVSQKKVITWGQIVDYFIRSNKRGITYVFFYLDEHNQRKRFLLYVPDKHRFHFAQIVEKRLNTRFNNVIVREYGKDALKQPRR